mgnify:CR=1 FL=1
MEEEPHILGLALGGGAFRGTAHLGVLKALEEEGLRPGFLCGTSAGAMQHRFMHLGWLQKKFEILPEIYAG